MPIQHEGIASRLGNPSFLGELECELASIRNRVQDIGQRLQDTGFYGPPEDAAKATPVQPAENNTRGRILDEMRYLSNHVGRVEHQIAQLA